MKEFFAPWWKLGKNHKELLLEGESISSSKVDSKNGLQSLKVKVAGIHPQKCAYAIPKMANFKNYKNYSSIIKKSRYDGEKAWFYLDGTLLPFAMTIEFKIPPIKKVGDHLITLQKGIFPGLKAKLRIRDFKSSAGKCLFSLDAKWKGKETKIPDLVMKAFTQTLTKITLDALIRKTRY